MTDRAWIISPDTRPDMAQVTYEGAYAEALKKDGMPWLSFKRDDLPKEFLPLQVRQSSGSLPPMAFLHGETHSELMVNRAMHDVILRMDPEACWFGPMAFETLEGNILRNAYWLFRVRKRLPALVPEKSIVKRARRSVRAEDGSIIVVEGDWTFRGVPRVGSATLSRDAVAGHHVWRLEHVDGMDIFVSDALLEALLDAGCEPIRRIPVDLI